MAKVARFLVVGEAITQGSMNTGSRNYRDRVSGELKQKSWAHHQDPRLLDWRRLIASQAQAQCPGIKFLAGTPVVVRAVFWLKRIKKPKSHLPVTKKDLDKLARAVLDSLNSVLYDDDKQVTELHVKKRYTNTDRVGAVIYVTEDEERVGTPVATWPTLQTRLFE